MYIKNCFIKNTPKLEVGPFDALSDIMKSIQRVWDGTRRLQRVHIDQWEGIYERL